MLVFPQSSIAVTEAQQTEPPGVVGLGASGLSAQKVVKVIDGFSVFLEFVVCPGPVIVCPVDRGVADNSLREDFYSLKVSSPVYQCFTLSHKLYAFCVGPRSNHRWVVLSWKESEEKSENEKEEEQPENSAKSLHGNLYCGRFFPSIGIDEKYNPVPPPGRQ